jgi:hypothetical protein
MAALEQHGRQPAAHIAGAAREEDALLCGFHAASIYARKRKTDLQIAVIADIAHDRRSKSYRGSMQIYADSTARP